MRLEVIKGETLGELNKHFRRKVQLQEELDENEVHLHFKRGIMEGLLIAQRAISDVEKGDKIEQLRQERAEGDHKEVPVDA